MDYVDQDFLFLLQEQIHKTKASMWIKKAWSPKIEQKKDWSLMDLFSHLLSGATTLEQEKTNKV